MKNILETKLHDEKAALNHVYALGFSRTATTVGEMEALQYIEKTLIEEGLTPEKEYFDWTGPKRILMRLFYIIFLVYLALYRMFLLIIIFFSVKYLFPKLRKYSLIQREESKNIYTKISAKNKKNKNPIIIFCAHYDSFSAKAPYRLQTVLFFVFRIIIVPYFLILIILSVFIISNMNSFQYERIGFFEPLILISTSIEFVIIIFIFLLIYDNKKSKGSIDNASGVSILIELMKLIKRDPLENMDVLFLWTGAEEWGLMGSKKFLKRHKTELIENYDLNHSYSINIDMVGTYIGLLDRIGYSKKRPNKDLNEFLAASAIKLNIPVVKYDRIFSPNSDYRSFRSFAKKTKTSFQVALFHSEKDTKYIHSSQDTPDKCSHTNLNGCLEICHDAIRTIDSFLP